MNRKIDIITRLLRKHALTLSGEPNMRAWDYFVAIAQSDKDWARQVTPQFLQSACDVTRQMAKRYRETPTAILAAQHYGYSYYRGYTTSTVYGGQSPLCRATRKLWDGFETAETIRETTGE